MIKYQRFTVIFAPKSTRSNQYKQVRPKLIDMATASGANFQEIRLEDTPYLTACNMIARDIADGDLVIAAGGDGTAQITFDALYSSRKAATFTTIPLGNGNDISHAFNKSRRSPNAILQQPVDDFYPLNIYINGKRRFSLASYITFGATTVLVDYLNEASSRVRRRRLKALSPAMSIPVARLSDISKCINNLNFPDFRRDGSVVVDDSIGFFVISAARNILRVPRDLLTAGSEFFFHHATTNDKGLARKVLMAGAWTLKFPGDLTNMEELDFVEPVANLTANVAGDNITLGLVRQIGALRSQRSVQVLLNR